MRVGDTDDDDARGFIDAHHHLWDPATREHDWLAAAELAPLRRAFTPTELHTLARDECVTATVLVQTVTEADETPELLAIADTDDLIAGVVGWTDLTAPDVADTLARLSELPGGHKLVGIRHQIQLESDPEWILRPEALRGLAAVAAAGLAYDLVVRPHQLPAAAKAAARLPELTFILDHLGKPPIAAGQVEPWADLLRPLAAQPNTFCKLSGLVTEADWHTWSTTDLRPFADTALDAFGAQRLMFGSDWPVCTLAATYTEVITAARTLTAQLGADERQAVFATTAARAYGLDS